MSSTPIQSANIIQDLAASVTRKLDADGDGKLSAAEFAGFLTRFLDALESNPLRPSASSGTHGAPATDTSASRRVVGKLSGYSRTKLADPNHNTTKYRIGRILQYYPNTPQGLRGALPELQQIVPGLKITGSKGDKLDFGDYVDPEGHRIGVVDVIQSAGSGGTTWQWLVVK